MDEYEKPMSKSKKRIYSLGMIVLSLIVIFYGFSFVFSSFSLASNPFFSIELLLLVIVIISALIGAYFTFRYMDTEKHIQFFDDEEVILDSKSRGTFATILSIGERDQPLDPIKSNIYLTSIGLIVEPKDSGEIAIFIPHDMMRDIGAFQNGIRIRYVDVKMRFNEIYLIVDDRDGWLNTLYEIHNIG